MRRNGADNKPAELSQYEVVKDIRELKDVDVAILATPTRSCEEYAKQILPLGINTVDSFDIHTSILDYRAALTPICKEHKAVSIISAGWDPGSDSIVRNSCRVLHRRDSAIPTSDRVCRWVTAYAALKGGREECSFDDYT